MESPVARILSVKGSRAIVSIDAASLCPRCAAGKGCGAGLLTGSVRNREIEVFARPDLRLAVGDRVYLTMPDADLLRAAVFAYGLPLAGSMIALGLGWLVLGPLTDTVAVSAASAGLLLGWISSWQALRGARCRRQFLAEIVVRHEPAE